MPDIRSDQALITLHVADERDVLIPFGDAWYSLEGANLESDDSHTRAGGMGTDKSLGGPSARGDCTLTVQNSDVTIGWHKTLELRVQQDAPVAIGYAFYDRLKNPKKPGFTVTGTLKSAFLPDSDTGSSDAGMYTVIVSCDEQGS